MPEIKKDCFAYLSDNKWDGCFCLNELYCRKENCRFYQTRQEARKKYLETYNMTTLGMIAGATDRYFRNL